jgi:hypothetical protein
MKNIEDGLFMKDVNLYRYVIASGVFPYPMTDLAYTDK